MAVHPQQVKEIIEKALPGAEVIVEDPMGDGDHLQAVVISNLFEGKKLLQQHQMVFTPLKAVFNENLHALALKTYTPEQWSKKG